MYVLKHLEYLERLPSRVKEKIFEKAMDIATLTNLKKKDRRAYEQKGLEKGREERAQIGLEKGKMEVLRSGIINLFEKNIPLDLIAEVMEVDVVEVKRILKEEGLIAET
jgi:hypothetical protein